MTCGTARPVGRMQIELRLRAGEQAADVKLKILSGDRYVELEGIVVREPRSGLGHAGGPAAGGVGGETALA
jgi:hypothetical protein